MSARPCRDVEGREPGFVLVGVLVVVMLLSMIVKPKPESGAEESASG